MNMTNQSAVAQPVTRRKTRSKFAYLFDLADEKEARVCACMSVFHRGKTYEAVKFKPTYRAIGDKSHRAIFEVVRMPRRFDAPLEPRGIGRTTDKAKQWGIGGMA